MIINHTFVKVFTNCLVVKGVNRSLVVDLQRDSFETIPDTLHDVIELFHAKKSIEDVYLIYGIENKEVIDEYVSYIIDNEFGVLTDFDEFDLYIDMDYKFDFPSQVSNCVIEISEVTTILFKNIIKFIENVNIKNIQMIFYDEVELNLFTKFLTFANSEKFDSVEIVTKFSTEFYNFIPNLTQYNQRIVNLIFHSSEKEYINETKSGILISHVKNNIRDFSYCGVINSYYFNVNRDKVLESLNHNSCLNKKISIDKNGNIKNCPSMPESFGNIKDISLEDALNHPEFKNYWNINKDQIEVCKYCEFRHICTDCRAYLEEPENIYSKPLKCGYNPYTNQWSEWSTNPLKNKAIEHYGMQDLVKKDA